MNYTRTASPRGASDGSRRDANYFSTRAWLDRPLPMARTVGRHLLAAVEPALAPIYWAALSAKSALEDEQANAEADCSDLSSALRASGEDSH